MLEESERDALEGQVVVVTGGGRGIGRAVAEFAADCGATVVVADRGHSLSGEEAAGEGSPAEEVSSRIVSRGGTAIAVEHDVGDEDGAGAIMATTLETFGRLDAIVLCAGMLAHNRLVDTTVTEWDRVIDSHLRGHFLCARAAAPAMIDGGRGRMVFVSSWSGIAGNADQPAYSAAKAGILGLAIAVHKDLGPRGIGVNVVLPGAATRMTDMIWERQRVGEENRDLAMRSADATGTHRDPSNIAPFICYLASMRSDHIRGETFAVVGHQVTHVQKHQYGRTMRSSEPWTIEAIEHAMRNEMESTLIPVDLQWPPP